MLHDAKLYGILDLGYVPQDALSTTATLLAKSGAGIVQLRAKGFLEPEIEAMALEVQPIFREAGIPFIINDFPEIAGRVDADGFHLGQDDGPREAGLARFQSARHPSQPERVPIIGRSTHSVEQATAAPAEGCDYIGYGPLFATPTKQGRPGIGLDDIAEVHQCVEIPIFCIGGIKLDNLAAVAAAGAQRVVIVSGLLDAGEAIPDRAGEILSVLG